MNMARPYKIIMKSTAETDIPHYLHFLTRGQSPLPSCVQCNMKRGKDIAIDHEPTEDASPENKRSKSSLFPALRFSIAELMDFECVADLLINRCTLHLRAEHSHTEQLTTHRFQLCEVEFYVHYDAHMDRYAHCNEDQLQYNKFYWRKTGPRATHSFQGGNYKGFNVCLGNASTGFYYGVLVRTMKNLDTDEVIEGPCKSANAILHALGATDVKSFMAQYPHMQSTDCDDASSVMHLRASADRRERLFKGPRIGLSDKHPSFRARLYRFCTAAVRKGKKSLLPC